MKTNLDDLESLKYYLALCLVPQVGPILGRNLIKYFGHPAEIFKASIQRLEKVPSIGQATALQIKKFDNFERAEEEIDFINKNKVKVMTIDKNNYPSRLKLIPDAPLVLFQLGNGNLEVPKCIGIVGTRNMSAYGYTLIKELIEGLKSFEISVISGMAYGVDFAAHQLSLHNKIPTFSVMAHGLDKFYPTDHRETGIKMLKNGGIITEYFSKTNPDKENFPTRNRVVAGLVDALIVVETKIKGGAMITAEIANSYHREVFAYPGRTTDKFSSGCHDLIKKHKAYLVESSEDIIKFLNWDLPGSELKPTQKPDLLLTDDESDLFRIIENRGKIGLDDISDLLQKSTNELSLVLLNLEIRGLIRGLPGKIYELC